MSLPTITFVGILLPFAVFVGLLWWYSRRDSEMFPLGPPIAVACAILTAAALWPALVVAWWVR